MSKRASSEIIKICETSDRITQPFGKKRKAKKRIILGAENIAKLVKICTAAQGRPINSKRVWWCFARPIMWIPLKTLSPE